MLICLSIISPVSKSSFDEDNSHYGQPDSEGLSFLYVHSEGFRKEPLNQ
jgi:hypothetical protein